MSEDGGPSLARSRVDGNEVVFVHPDPDHELTGVRLWQDLGIAVTDLAFAPVPYGWELRLPRPSVREWCANHLPDLDNRVLDWVSGPDFDRLLVDTVTATYPKHEREECLAHFRGLVGMWSPTSRRRPSGRQSAARISRRERCAQTLRGSGARRPNFAGSGGPEARIRAETPHFLLALEDRSFAGASPCAW